MGVMCPAAEANSMQQQQQRDGMAHSYAGLDSNRDAAETEDAYAALHKCPAQQGLGSAADTRGEQRTQRTQKTDTHRVCPGGQEEGGLPIRLLLALGR